MLLPYTIFLIIKNWQAKRVNPYTLVIKSSTHNLIIYLIHIYAIAHMCISEEKERARVECGPFGRATLRGTHGLSILSRYWRRRLLVMHSS